MVLAVSVLLEVGAQGAGALENLPTCFADWSVTSGATFCCLFFAAALLKRQSLKGLWPFSNKTDENLVLLFVVGLLAAAELIETAEAAAAPVEILLKCGAPLQQLVLLCSCGLLGGQALQGSWLLSLQTGLAALAAGMHLRAAAASSADAIAVALASGGEAAAAVGCKAAETEAASCNRLLLLQLLLLLCCNSPLGENLQQEGQEPQQHVWSDTSAAAGVLCAAAVVACLYSRERATGSWKTMEVAIHVPLLLCNLGAQAARFVRQRAKHASS